MKFTGILACFLLLATASVRADSFSFRDNYFKNGTIDLRGLSLPRERHTARGDQEPWTLPIFNEGPLGFLSSIDPTQRPVKLATLRKTPKVSPSRKVSVLPFVRPDETINYQLSVVKPKPGVDYKLTIVPGESKGTPR